MKNHSKEEGSTIYCWKDPAQSDNALVIPLPEEVVQISCGVRHLLVRTTEKLYGFGSEEELGVQDRCYQQLEVPMLIQLPNPSPKHSIQRISCGHYHTLILDDRGTVYACGKGKSGALGYGRGSDSSQFKPVVGGINFISAGKDHSLALSPVKAYGWGNSKDGQLGLVKEQIYFQPQQLFIYVSNFCYAGSKYSIFNTQKGVYGAGYNQQGQLGLGHEKKTKIPKKINIPDTIISCSGCSSTLIFQTSKKQFYITGRSSFGDFIYPTKIKKLRGSQSIALSESMGIRQDNYGNCYTWNPMADACPTLNLKMSELQMTVLSSGPCMIAGARTTQSEKQFFSNRTQEKHIYPAGQAFSEISRIRADLNSFPSAEGRAVCREETSTPLFNRSRSESHSSPPSSGNRSSFGDFIRQPFPVKDKVMDRQFTYEQLQAKIQNLEKDNKQKDHYIKRMRRQFTDIVDLVESERSLKNIIETKNPYFLDRIRQELGLQEQTDPFAAGMNKLREILDITLGQIN